MSEKQNISFEVDTITLQQSSKRPSHLDARMSARKLRARTTVKDAEKNRKAFLDARRNKLAKQYIKSRNVMSLHFQRTISQEKDKKAQLNRDLQAAEAKRHLLLAKHVKNCSIAVKRAKEVARLQSIRYENEQQKRRAELDMRLSHSVQRRNRFLQSARNKINSGCEQISLEPLDAVVRLQNWWRKIHFTSLIQKFKTFNLNTASASEMNFSEIASLLKNKLLLGSVTSLLDRVRNTSPFYSDDNKYKNSVKVFLCAFLISVHPLEILGEIDSSLPKQLYDSSMQMLTSFESWLRSLGKPDFYTKLHKFLAQWDKFYFNFEAWKTSDVHILVENMTQHFLDLDNLWFKVKDDISSQSWYDEIDKQREDLISQLRVIGGEPAVSELKKKSRLYRESLITSDLSADESSKPQAVYKNNVNSVAPEMTLSNSTSSLDTNELDTLASELPKLTKIPNVSNTFTSRELAHEIIMNPEFKFEANDDADFKRVHAIATKAFFDLFREKIQVNELGMFIEMMAELRARILQLLPPEGHFVTNFKERFDLELIEQQVHSRTFQPQDWIHYVISLLKVMCAPIRDPDVARLGSINDPIDAFQNIFEFLNWMLIDHMNHQINTLRPLLAAQGTRYETDKFSQELETGVASLDKTKLWLNSSIQETLETLTARDPNNATKRSVWPSFESIFNDAYVSLLFSKSPITRESAPETFFYDTNRLFEHQNSIQCIAVVAVLVMISQNVADKLKGSASALDQLKSTLFILLNDKGTTIDNIVSHLAQFLLPYTSHGNLERFSTEQYNFLNSMVQKTLSYRDPVYLLLSRRLQRILRQLVGQEHVEPLTFTANGLSIVTEEIIKLGGNLAHLASFNRKVYSQFYDSIISKQLNEILTDSNNTSSS